MDKQKLLFEGYIRIEILETLSDDLISTDVINICNAFFEAKIEELAKEHLNILLEDDDYKEWLTETADKNEVQMFV